MQCIDLAEYDDIRKGASILEADVLGEKVLILPDGSFLKLFYTKGLFSSAFFYPYAQRFADSTRILQQLGIPCPEVIRVVRIKKMKRDAVLYRPLAGTSLRHWIACLADTNSAPREDKGGLVALEPSAQSNGQPVQSNELLCAKFGAFVAHLHEAGIYFRALHLGNVIPTPDNRFGLIDIADLSVRRRPLTPSLTRRNFHRLLRDKRDRAWILADQGIAFFTAYCRDRTSSRHDLQKMLDSYASMSST